MLTKEAKQIAEKMGQELKPLFETAHKLGETLKKARNNTSHAHRVATAWQYPSVKGYADDAGEDSETIQKTRNEEPKKWHDILQDKYIKLNECETLENVAKLNYRNYISYICDYIADFLHRGDTWAKFYEKKGLETLSDLLREQARDKKGQGYMYISRDGTGWEAFGSPRFYCYLYISFYGVCSINAKNWGTYQENSKSEEPCRMWEKPKEPKRYTLAQYLKLIKELKTLEADAKEKARQHHQKAKESGLIYFEGGLNDPKKEVWGKRE